MPKRGIQAMTTGWIQVHNKRPMEDFRLICLWYSGLQMAKYVSTLIAVSVKSELMQNTMLRKPFNLHRTSLSTHSWFKHVYNEKGMQIIATPISAHDRLMIKMFVRVRSLRCLETARQTVPFPIRVASMISTRLPLIRRPSSSLYVTVVGSVVPFMFSTLTGENLSLFITMLQVSSCSLLLGAKHWRKKIKITRWVSLI